MSKLIEQLREKRNLTDEQLKELIETDGYDKELFASAVDIRGKSLRQRCVYPGADRDQQLL